MSEQSKNKQGKDVVYIDVEEEITGIIDKIRGSDQRIVALVLPKRANALQSIVNMKLLKRTTDEAKKHVVLITSESSLLPLAGSVGLHVAKSLQSKPEVPDAPDQPDDQAETVEEDELPVDKNKSIGELNGDDEEAIELDDIDEENPAEQKGLKAVLKGKNRKLHIPNFGRFRLWIFVGTGGLILLVVCGFLAFSVLPKAQIVVKTDSEALDISQDITVKAGDNVTLDVQKGIVPAQKQETSKEISQEAAATGQKNNGEKATGSVDMAGKDCSGPSYTPPTDVLSGSGITVNGKTYVTQKKASFTPHSFDSGSGCFSYKANNIDIVAQNAGADANVSGAAFVVAGRSDVTAMGSASGGTDDIIKVISQSDIDSAKQKITNQDAEAVKQELIAALQGKDLRPVESSLTTTTPHTEESAKAGDQADKVTVTQKVTYSMLGVRNDDLQQIITNAVTGRIDPQHQSILDYGLGKATFTSLTTQPEATTIGLQTTVVAGPNLDAGEIKKQILGKKANDAKEVIQQYPGVTDVRVTYSPFWVSSIPKKSGKVTLTIEKPESSSGSKDANTPASR